MPNRSDSNPEPTDPEIALAPPDDDDGDAAAEHAAPDDASADDFRALVEHAPDGVAVYRDWRFVYVNRALLAMLGYAEPAEMLGRHVLEVIHPDDQDNVAAQVLATSQLGKQLPPQDFRVLRKDGSVARAEIIRMRIRFEGGAAVAAFGRDVTERRRTQARAAVAERMAALGTFAGAVSREFNSPLASVAIDLAAAGAELRRLLRDHEGAVAAGRAAGNGGGGGANPSAAPAASRVTAALDRIEKALPRVERMQRVVREMRGLSHGGEVREAIDPARALDAALECVAHAASAAKVRLVREPAAGETKGGAPVPPPVPLPLVHANEALLAQALVQLLANAVTAAGEGGTVVARVEGDPRGRVLFEVRDGGPGIPAAVMPRVFDPFFTTRGATGATGLGLAVCHTIVTSLGGELTLESEPSKRPGTVARVALPAASTGGGGAGRHDGR